MSIGDWDEGALARFIESVMDRSPLAALARAQVGFGGMVQGTTGAILAGGGFTVVRTGLGAYSVTFTRPFAAIPIVTLACAFGIQLAGALPTASGFTVQTFNTSTLAAGDFNWTFAVRPG